jgi:hypothetical protein
MLTLKDFKNIFGNRVSLKNDIIDVCLGKIRNDKFDLIYRVSVLDISEIEEFIKLGFILLVKKRKEINTETSYSFNQKPYIIKEYYFGAKI